MHLTIQKIQKITPPASGESNNLLIGLQKRAITLPDKALRAELSTLVKSEREKFPDKVMETVAKEYGHEILRVTDQRLQKVLTTNTSYSTKCFDYFANELPKFQTQ